MENGTIFQKLNGYLNTKTPPQVDTQKIIIKGDSKEDFHKKELEFQQQQYLNKQYSKLKQNTYQNSLSFETSRYAAYVDFEAMEYYPIIAAALDIFAEESTSVGDNGYILNIYSNNSRIKGLLESLFYKTLGVNSNLHSWARNLCKYGDNFLFLMGEAEKGITAVKQLPNIEIERIEKEEKGKFITTFKHDKAGNTYTNFQIAHFRLLADDKFLPYGNSIVNKIRRTYHMLRLSEDAMMTYRVTRAGEKRVYKVFVGDIATTDVQAYMQKVAQGAKKTQQITNSDGSINFKMNVQAMDEDIFIPVRSENAGTQIDTLPGASNLNDIMDISYLRSNLFTGLGIPKSFLTFDGDAAMGGKNSAMEDIRFARKVNRIQQSLLEELNKIAITHLYLLGFEDELDNFELSLNNPSTQSEILKIESLTAKITAYKELTTNETGAAAMSKTKAKQEIFGMTEDEIIEDLVRQRYERVVDKELQTTPNNFKSSGIFTEVDKKLESLNIGQEPTPDTAGEEQSGGGEEATSGIESTVSSAPTAPEPGTEAIEPQPVGEDVTRKSKVLSEEVRQIFNKHNELKNKTNYLQENND